MTADLYPLSNLMMVVSPDTALLDDVGHRMRRSSFVTTVSSGADFVVGITDLPGRPSVPYSGPEGFAWFAEGQAPTTDQTMVATALDCPTNLAALPGDAGFVALRDRRLSVVRSRRGLVPWYCFERRDCVVVSTRNAWFPLLLPFTFEPDPLVHIGMSDDGVLPDRRGLWLGTRVLRTGHRWHGAVGEPLREVSYWDPTELVPSRPVGLALVEEVARQVRSTLIKTLRADLDPSGSNLLGLSGGVDSSCLASMAAHQVKVPFMSLTLAPPGETAAHKKMDSYVDSIVDHVGPTRMWMKRHTQLERVELCRTALCLGMPVPHPSMQLLPTLAAEERLTVFTGGELADDFFAGPEHIRFDWADAAGPSALLSAFRSPTRATGRRELLGLAARNAGRAVLRRRGKPTYLSEASLIFSPELRTEFNEWKDRTERNRFQYDQPYGAVRMVLFEMDGWLLQNWEVCRSLGIRRSVPFVERDLVELACSFHPTDHAMPTKRVIRMAFRGDVPALNIERPGKGIGSDASTETFEVTVGDELEGWLDPALFNKTGKTKLPLDLAWYYEVIAVSTQAVTTG